MKGMAAARRGGSVAFALLVATACGHYAPPVRKQAAPPVRKQAAPPARKQAAPPAQEQAAPPATAPAADPDAEQEEGTP